MEPLPTPSSFAPSTAVSLAPRGLPIPDGRYRLTAVAPRLLMDPAYRLERADTAGTRFDFGGRAIESFRPTLAGQHRREAILISPEPGRDPVLGFRGLAGQQVEALRRDGFEPAWVVKVGERFDVLLRPHTALEAEDARALRDHLAKTYELPDQRGVFQNAVRLPGHAFPHAGQIHEPALVEVRAEPFSASRAIVGELQQARLRETIEHTARELPKLQELQTLPLVVAETSGPPRPALPHPEVERLQAQIDRPIRTVRLPESQALGDASPGQLLVRAKAANETLLGRGLLDGGKFPAQIPVELAALESELAHRLREVARQLPAADRQARLAVRALEASAREVREAPSAETVARYTAAVHVAHTEMARLDDLSRQTLFLKSVQLDLDQQRFAAALVGSPIAEHEGAFRDLVRQHFLLEARSGYPGPPSSAVQATLPELREHGRVHEQTLGALREALGQGDPTRLGDFIATHRELAFLPPLEQRLELRQAASLDSLALPAGGASPEEIRQRLFAHQATLARLGRVEDLFHFHASSPADALALATERVARWDLSAEALRRLNGDILSFQRDLPVHYPPPARQANVTELFTTYRETLRQVQSLAAAASPEKSPPPDLGPLLKESYRAVELHQRVERYQRQRLGLAEPHPAPAGVAELPWRAAWLQRAEAVGLKPEVAAAHLGNAFPSPMLSGHLAMRVPVAQLALDAVRSAKASLDLTHEPGLRR